MGSSGHGRAVIGAGARVAVLALVGLLVVMVGGGWITNTRAEGPPRLVFTSDRAPDYASEVYSLDVARRTHRRVSRDVHADQLLAVRQGEVLFTSERRGKALYAARLGSRSPVRRLSALPDGATADGASWSRGGELAIVLTREDGAEPLVELLGRSGRSVALFTGTGPAWAPDDGVLTTMSLLRPSMWSADGRLLALHDFGIRLVDASGRQRLRLKGDEALWADAAPRLAVYTADPYSDEPWDGSTVILDERGRTIRRFAGRTLALSPDGRTVVLARRRGTTWLASVKSGKLHRLTKGLAPVIFLARRRTRRTEHRVRTGSCRECVVWPRRSTSRHVWRMDAR